MEFLLLLKGVILGFSVSAPLGPIGLICVNRTLSRGPAAGFFSGLGVATADMIYAAVAGFGITFVSNFLVSQQVLLQVFGGLFLCYLGWRIYHTRPREECEVPDTGSFLKAFFSTFFLTMTNPLAILLFAAFFAGLGITVTGGDYFAVSTLIAGVFGGSVLWWLLLIAFVSWFRNRISPRKLAWVNKVSSAILFATGILVLLAPIFMDHLPFKLK